MLTPEEELGLAGRALFGRVERAVHALGGGTLHELLAEIEDESRQQRLFYLRTGVQEVVRVFAAPLPLLAEQVQYLHAIALELHNATRRLISLYLADERMRHVLLLSPEEEAWLRELWTPAHAEENPVFGRLDAVFDGAAAHWKAGLQFIEPNMGGVGGLHLWPAAEREQARLVWPALAAVDPELRLELGHDVRNLLMQLLIDHLEAVGASDRCICFVEAKYADSGPDDQAALAEYFQRHFHVQVLHADPAELVWDGAQARYRGAAIDLVYRDYAVEDLVALAAKGVDVTPMRELMRRNRVVSSLAAELDQKSVFEVFTDPELSAAHFTPDERRLFRRHVPWTRLVRERRCLLPDGTTGELLEYARAEQEHLVIKPNRGYGGHGVCVGPAVSPSAWEAAIHSAVLEPDRWVVQRAVPLPVHEFPVATASGVAYEPFRVVFGLAPTEDGLAVLGRASQKQVVNIAQRGGLVVCPVVRGR
jgi:hypothetical protein